MNCYHLINKNSEEKCLHTVINGVTDNIFHTVWDNIRFHVQENIFMNIQRNIKSMFLSTKPENPVWDNIRFHVQENIFMNIQRNIKSMFLSTKPENLYFMVYNSEHEYNPKKPSKKQFDNAYKLLETI